MQRALHRLRAGTTTLLITHRMATAALADTIVVLDDRVIAEAGTHRELVAAGGIYARRCGLGPGTENRSIGDPETGAEP